jgi:hypothetical protein
MPLSLQYFSTSGIKQFMNQSSNIGKLPMLSDLIDNGPEVLPF